MRATEGLAFEPDSHTYRYHGRVVPSVTQVLESWSTMRNLPPELLAIAGRRGHLVHEATELDDHDDLNEAWAESVGVLGHVRGWRRFRREHEFEPVAIEYRVYSSEHRFAGTLDRFGPMRWPGARNRASLDALIDIKSGVSDPTHCMQTAGYAGPIGHRGPRGCVYLHPDGTYDLQPHAVGTGDWIDFLACLRHYRWKERHGYRI